MSDRMEDMDGYELDDKMSDPEDIRTQIAALKEGEELRIAAPAKSTQGELLGPVMIVRFSKERRPDGIQETTAKIGYDARSPEPPREMIQAFLELVNALIGRTPDEVSPTSERMREAGGGLG